MQISRMLLAKAVQANIINDSQAQALYAFFQQETAQNPSFDFTNVLYYLGGLIAIGAMTLFMTFSWEYYGGKGIFFLSCLYAVLGLLLTELFARRDYKIPAGIFATFVIALTPLAIFGLQRWLWHWPNIHSPQGIHGHFDWHWMSMELGTLFAGIALAFWYRYPFMVMPIAATLWFIAIDLGSLFGPISGGFEFSAQITMYFGLLVTIAAFYIDLRSRNNLDYAFWLYIFGVFSFWIGLTSIDFISEWGNFLYLCINIIMLFAGVLLNRKVFVVFAALGITVYLINLASTLFPNTIAFRMALVFIGFFIIYLGTIWHRYEETISKKVQQYLPRALQELFAARE